MYTVYLSPSNQTDNMYAGVPGVSECDNCYKIAKEIQLRGGRFGSEIRFIVPDKFSGMDSRIAGANGCNADLYVAIHTNAFNGTVTGTRTFYPPNAPLSNEIARLCAVYLGRFTGSGTMAEQRFYELTNTVMPATLVEVDFHDNPVRAQWLVNNNRLIAECFLKAICKYLNIQYFEGGEQPMSKYFVDVPKSAYYSSAVDKIHELGLMNGVGDNRFEPTKPITRGDLALVMSKLYDMLKDK